MKYMMNTVIIEDQISEKPEKVLGIELGMPEKIPTDGDLYWLRSFEPKEVKGHNA